MVASDGLNARAEAVRQFHHDELKKHGAALRKKLIRSAKDATGGDRKLSGLGNKPVLGVRLRTERGGRSTTVTLTPSPKAAKGPWSWIQDGTRSGRRARRVSARNGHSRTQATLNARYSYLHPGTAGSNAWFGPVDSQMPKIRAELRSAFNALGR